VTFSGGSFSSRVAGSLLYDIEMSQLATSSYSEYKDKALSIANNASLKLQLQEFLMAKLNKNNWPVQPTDQVVAFINTLVEIK